MRILGSVLTDKIVGVNLKTGNELWYKEIPEANSYNIRTDVVGEGEDFYYFEQTKNNSILRKGNVVSGQATDILEIQPAQGYNYCKASSNVIFVKEKKLIIIGAWEMDTTNRDYSTSKNYLCILDLKTNTILNKVYSELFEPDMSISHIYSDGGKIYAACGLTTICYNLNTQIIDWTYKSTESYNYMTNNVVVNNGIVFLYGDNRFVGLNAETGEKLYQGDNYCSEANAFNGYVYLIGDSKLYILDIKTGKTLHRIICPEEYTINEGFNPYCIPTVYGDKLYVFGYYHAYCYEAIPKEEY